MIDVREYFKEQEESFTIYVVEQHFAVGIGSEYFKSFRGKPNYINTNTEIKKRLHHILKVIMKNVPNVSELIKICFNLNSPVGLIEIISILSKLFSVNEHQAAGIEVIDPIIIQEGEILQKYVNQIIALHQSSILKPTIIIILKDNNFDRARTLLSKCPHNTNIKMIRNNGDSELFKVINTGSDNIDEFIEAFSTQCFSTCSNTKRNILYNEEWADNSEIKLYVPTILQMRTDMLFRDKTLLRKDLNAYIDKISLIYKTNPSELLLSFECVLKLFRVFCNDGGKKDILDSLNIATELDNDILKAHVYRNAYFLDGYSFEEKLQMMDSAYSIFKENGMEDHAIYCKNNELVRQFDTDSVSVYDFLNLQEEAINNVPGLVGMSHILNNVGAALLTNGYPDRSIEYFDKGLNYACRPERCIQKVALLSNKAIAKSYCYNQIDEVELNMIMKLIFDNKEIINLPFLSARYALNVVALGYQHKKTLGLELLNTYPVKELIQSSLNNNVLGSGQLLLQMNLLESKYGVINDFDEIIAPPQILDAKGIRKNFIEKSTFNPCSFSTWF